jgi:hypothetical protein
MIQTFFYPAIPRNQVSDNPRDQDSDHFKLNLNFFLFRITIIFWRFFKLFFKAFSKVI